MTLHISLIGFPVTKRRVILLLNNKMIVKVIQRKQFHYLEKEGGNIHLVKMENLLI
jgi:hypothetical protein